MDHGGVEPRNTLCKLITLIFYINLHIKSLSAGCAGGPCGAGAL